MSFLVKALAKPAKLYNAVKDEVAKDRRLRLQDGAGWARFSGRQSNSGKYVTDTSAMQVAAVWACIKITAQAVSSLPLGMYQKDSDGGRNKVDGGRLAQILTESPNRDQTALEYWESQVAWLMTRGNAYAEKVETGPRLTSLEPLPASHTTPFRNSDGELMYRFTDRGKSEVLPRDKVFHIKGFGQGLGDRDLGLSPIAAGTNSIGAAMAAQEAGASTFANGMSPSGFFLFKQALTDEQRTQARKNLIGPMSGSSNAGSVGLLENDVTWQSVSLNPEDAQLLETRRFDVEEVCRWFGVPPVVIGHSAEGQTMWGSGVEQILISWLTLGIDPVCDRIEARIRKDLMSSRWVPAGQYAEFNREALLQMDSKAKAMFLATNVQNGLMTRNEGRAKLNLPRVEGGDQLTVQLNLAPIEALEDLMRDDDETEPVRALLNQRKGHVT